MTNRKGVGQGKGKGWKNLTASDSYRHALSSKGIPNAVSVTLSQRRSINNRLLPLLKTKTISGYNLVENPNLKPKHKYQVVYGHDDMKHKDLVVEELRRKGLDFYAVPRESSFLDEKSFVKSSGQVRQGDIVKAKEYQLIIDVPEKKLEKVENFLRTRTVNYDDMQPSVVGLTDPSEPQNLSQKIEGSYTVPDIRLRKRNRFPRFRKVDKIVKKVDKNSDLVILSVRENDTKKIKDALVGEKASNILIQDYTPKKHSLYDYIKRNTK